MTKYAGLMFIADSAHTLEKRALLEGWNDWERAHPLLNMGMYFIPGVGTAAAGADAVHSFSKGDYLAGMGNLGVAALSLTGAGGLARMLGIGAKAARGANAVAHSGRIIDAGLRGAQAQTATSLWPKAWNAIRSPYFKAKDLALNAGGEAGATLSGWMPRSWQGKTGPLHRAGDWIHNTAQHPVNKALGYGTFPFMGASMFAGSANDGT